MFRKDEPGAATLYRVDAPSSTINTDSEPEATKPQTLRDMFYSSEPWNVPEGQRLSPGMRRLQEKRVNRNLGIVAGWMQAIAEKYPDEEKVHHALLVEAERVRLQIMWPELEAHAAITALTKELESQ